MKTDRKARYQGYNFYFKEGFCWSDISTNKNLKCRLNNASVYDVKSMTLFSQYKNINDNFLVCIINSSFASTYVYNMINLTASFQINDARQIPIIVPSKTEIIKFNKIFEKALLLQKEKFNNKALKNKVEEKLHSLQNKLNKVVYDLYSL